MNKITTQVNKPIEDTPDKPLRLIGSVAADYADQGRPVITTTLTFEMVCAPGADLGRVSVATEALCQTLRHFVGPEVFEDLAERIEAELATALGETEGMSLPR